MPPSHRSMHHPPDPGNLPRGKNASDASARPGSPNGMSITDPPPAPPTGIDQLWDSITRSRNPDGSVLISAETFGILHVMIRDLRKVQTRLDVMAIQLERMDDLTRKVEELRTSRSTHELPKKPITWANVARKQTDTTASPPGPSYRLSTPQPPPSNRDINEFKPAQVIIRNVNTEKNPFEDKSTAEITDCVNFALNTLDIKPSGSTEPVIV